MPELTNTGIVGGSSTNTNTTTATNNNEVNNTATTSNVENNDHLLNKNNESSENAISPKVSNDNNKQTVESICLPWGAIREKPNPNASFSTSPNHQFQIDNKKPGEYLMHIVVFNFIQLSSKKFDQLVKEKRDRRLRDCFQKNDDLNLDRLIMTMGQVAEHSLPSLTRTLLIWHESQLANLNYLKQQQQIQFEANLNTAATTGSNNKSNLASKFNNQRLMQAKLENDLLDERKELIIHCLLCLCLIEVLKQLSFHPGNDDMLNYIIDLSFQRFLSKDQTNQTTSSSYVLHNQLYLDNLYVTDLYAEVIGTIAHSRFILVKRRFLNEFSRFKSSSIYQVNEIQNQSNSNTSNITGVNTLNNNSINNTNNINNNNNSQSNNIQQPQNSTLIQNNLNNSLNQMSTNRIKLLMGMKYFRIKMVPIEDFEASFQFLNACAQDFVESKDKDIKHTLAGLFVDILVPITGVVKNEVNVPCLRQFVDILYQSALELSAKTKHRFATFPLLTCLLCVSQRQFFLNNWFQFVQLCLQQLKTKESNLARLSLESIVRLVWIYMIRIKGEKSSETNQRLLTITQVLFPKGTKLVNPKEMPANIYVKLITYIAYERLDFAMKEIIYELLSIDVNNLNSNQNSEQNMMINNNSSNNNQDCLNNNSNNMNGQVNSNMQNPLLNPNLNLNSSLNNSMNNLSSSAFKTSKENLNIMPLKMEIGLKAFVQIADILQQQKENGVNPPSIPTTFSIPNNDILSIYLTNSASSSSSVSSTNNNNSTSSNNSLPKQRSSSVIQSNLINEMISQSTQQRVVLTDSLARDLGLGAYFDYVRRSFQDILKTLDFTIGRNFLMTRVENTSSTSLTTNELVDESNSNDKLETLNDLNSASIIEATSSSTNEPPNIVVATSESNTISQMNKDLMLNADNKSKLCLMRTCIAMIPRLMPQFKENELVEILTRLTIHIDDELRIISFQALKTFVYDYPKWRIYVFTGFTNFILKEISDMYPKLIENALKMLIQLLNTWKIALNINKTQINQNINTILLDDYCKIINHLEGFSLFTLCHSHVQRRRLGLEILKECKQIGELLKCFKFYPYHNYAIDVLDLAAIQAIKSLHLQCFNFSLIVTNMKPDLKYLIDQSANWEVYVNTSNYNSIFNSNNISSNNEPTTTSSNASSNSNSNQQVQPQQQQQQQQQQSPQVNSSSFYNNIITKTSRTSSAGMISTPSNPPVGTNNVLTEAAAESTDSNQSSQLNLNQLDSVDTNNSQQQQTAIASSNNNLLLQIQQPQINNTTNTPFQQQQKEQQQSTVTLLSHKPHSATQSNLNQSNNNVPTNSSSNMFAFDPWTECLSIFFSYDFIYTKCPQASYEVWPFIFSRLQQILPYVDPNEQHHETSRSSILFGVGANSLEKIRKAMNERDANLNLWKNYLIAACCLTSGSDRYLYYSDHEKALIRTTDETNESSNLITNSAPTTAPAAHVDFTIVESSSKFYTSSSTFGTATSLLKIIVPFLKCECNYFREIIIRGLGRINIEAIRDLIEELIPYIKECLDKRQEKSRRMKKRDTIRLAIVYIFELMSEQKTLGRRLIDTKRKLSHLKSQQHQLLMQKNEELFQTFRDYIDQMLLHLEQESDKNILDLNLQIRIHFSLLLHKLIDSINRDKRINLFSQTSRHNLFHLFDKWSGRFSLNQQVSVNSTNTQSNNSSNTNTLSNPNFAQSGLLSLSRFSSTPTNTLNNSSVNTNNLNSTSFINNNININNKNQLYTHHYHNHHHDCYHFYDELELAATKACASLLCCGDISEITLLNQTPTNQGLTINTNTNSVLFNWLSQLLENANQEMKMYDQCKCVLRNEIYTLSLNVCIQLLEISLYNSTNLNSFQLLFDWIIKKCYSSISQEIADLCFIALAKVFIEYLTQNLANKTKLQQQQSSSSPTKTTVTKIISSSSIVKNAQSNSSSINQNSTNLLSYQKTIDSIYLSNLLTLSLLNIGSTRLNIHETSICLLRIINKYYLQDTGCNISPINTLSSDQPLKVNVGTTEEETNNNINVESKASTLSSVASSSNKSDSLKIPSVKMSSSVNNHNNLPSKSSLANNATSLLDIDYDIINSMVIYSKSQLFISEYLARKNPEKTMFIFCELTSRLEQCSSHQLRRTMLNVLIPWLYNIELIDSNVLMSNNSSASSSLPKSMNGLAFLQLQSGYGSMEATEIILNNLFYLTCKFADQYSTEFELIWAILAFTWPSNLKIIIRFIFIMVTLASYDMIKYGKNVICYLAKACPERVSDELITELEFMDSLSNVIDKCESTFPFYRYNKPAPQPPPSPPAPHSPPPATTANIESISTSPTKKKSKKAFKYVVNHEDDVFSDDIEGDESDEFDEDDSEDDSEEEEEDDSDFELDDEEEISDESDDDSKLDNQSDNESDNKLIINNQKDKLLDNIRRNERLLLSSSSNLAMDNSNNKIQIEPLPMPSNYKSSYACPLNILLYHVGHQHHHSHHNSIYSYHNNYMHHNHYPHISNISRGSIALMLLCELIGTDGADYDWTPYLPILFHYCLINFDSTKQLIGEHAKKLFLNLIYTLTVQNELYSLTDFLIESIGSIIDSQSIIFDRKYTNNNYLNESLIAYSTNILNNNLAKYNSGNCQYNYNFNMRIFSANLKGYSNNLLNNNISLMNSPSHRALINIHSAPSSPASQNLNNNCNNSNNNNKTEIQNNVQVSNSVQDSNLLQQPATGKDIKKSNMISSKKQTKIQKAKEHLSVILNILAKCKNSPVWPYELITSHTFSKQLTSVQLINDFVSNLQSFLQICFSTKQVSTISSSATRSFSSPLNLDLNRYNCNHDKFLTNLDKKWSHYALISSLNTTSRHYAGRSLQIYRALGIKFSSFSTMINLIHRLMETVADTNEDVQGYVTEILLTLKMNANLFSVQYLKLQSETKNKTGGESLDAIKQKSKSLQLQFQENMKSASKLKKNFIDQFNKKSATGSLSNDLIKNKTATLTRKEANEIMTAKKSSLKSPIKLQNTKYKHQIAYKKSLTLSLFNHKWQLLQERIGNSSINVNRVPKFLRYFNHMNKSHHAINTNMENLKILVQIFWTAICLLESDFEHEFVLAIEIIEQILDKIDLNTGLAQNGQLLIHKNEFRTHLEMFAFKINWPNFPGLQNLLMKGCISTNQTTLDATNRILVDLIPHCSKLNFVDPNGMSYNGLWGLSMNMIALLPTMIYNYESPNELCVKAAESYCKVIKEQIRILEEQQQKPQIAPQQYIGIQKLNKIENLKNLTHVMNLYLTNSFGKDRLQWTKCVITYLSEFFQLCKNETQDTTNKTNFYLNWIVFLTELLDKHSNNLRYQSCVMACLNSLLNFINFGDQTTWSFINEELTRVIVKYMNTNLWSEALDLIKLTVSKSSSLTGLNNTESSGNVNNQNSNSSNNLFNTQVPLPLMNNQLNLFGKKELPGRTLEFDFDFSLFLPSQDQFINFNPKTVSTNVKKPNNLPLNLIDFHSRKQFQLLNEYITGCNSNGAGSSHNLNCWRKPNGSQLRTRNKFLLLLTTLTRQQSINNLNTNTTNNNNSSTVNDTSNNNNIINNNNNSNNNNLAVSDSNSSLKKSSTSIIFENSLNNSQMRYAENLNSTTNDSSANNNNHDLTTTNATTSISTNNQNLDPSIIITSPISSEKLLSAAAAAHSFATDTSSSNSSSSSGSNNTTNSSSSSSKPTNPVVHESNSSSSSSSTSNLTNSSNNSLNQTSFITSPSSVENNIKFMMKKPAIISPKPMVSSNSAQNLLLSSPTSSEHSSNFLQVGAGGVGGGHSSKPSFHQRKNSTIYVKQHDGSLVPITQNEPTIQTLLTSDDNNFNFINNTFSFLDDMDNMSDIDGNSAGPTAAFGSVLTTVKEDSFINQNESTNNEFPWNVNAIYPINDEKIENEEINKATFRLKSKTKPLAPKIKPPSATIGVASGVEALRAIKNENNSNLYFNFSKNKPIAPLIVNSNNNAIISDPNLNNNSNNVSSVSPRIESAKKTIEKSISSPSHNEESTNEQMVHYQHEQPIFQQSPSSIEQENNRRRSITRIIKSGSYQNINQNIRHFSVSSILNKKPAPAQPSANSAATTSSSLEFQQPRINNGPQDNDAQSNSINQLSTNSSNVIYDHQNMNGEKTKPNNNQKSPNSSQNSSSSITHEISQIINQQRQRSSSTKNTILNNMANLNTKFDNIANILQNKRTKLRVSSVNNLSNLLAMDESSKSVNVDPKNINININLITDKSSFQPPPAILNINSNQAIINIVKNQNNKKGLTTSYSSSSLSTIHSQTEHDKNYELLKKQQEIYLKTSIKNIYSHVEPYINLMKSSQLDIDSLWKQHVNSTLKSSVNSETNIIETFILFKLLFNNIRSNLNKLLNECNQIISIQNLETHLVKMIDLINNKLNCPVIYLDQDLVKNVINQPQQQSTIEFNAVDLTISKQFNTTNSSIIDKHKHIVWEIGENYDTFIYLKQSVLESLDKIKKLESTNSHSVEVKIKKVELCKKIGKLLSQLMLLLQSSNKLVPNITKNIPNSTVVDKSSELARLNKQLIDALKDHQQSKITKEQLLLLSSTSSSSNIINQFVNNSKEMYTYLILESIKKNNFIETIEYIKRLNLFDTDDDYLHLDVALLFKCEQVRSKYPNMIAIIDHQSTDELTQTCQEILQLNIELTNMIDQVDKKIREANVGTSFSDGEEIDC